jgi:hypothetical protein
VVTSQHNIRNMEDLAKEHPEFIAKLKDTAQGERAVKLRKQPRILRVSNRQQDALRNARGLYE